MSGRVSLSRGLCPGGGVRGLSLGGLCQGDPPARQCTVGVYPI